MSYFQQMLSLHAPLFDSYTAYLEELAHPTGVVAEREELQTQQLFLQSETLQKYALLVPAALRRTLSLRAAALSLGQTEGEGHHPTRLNRAALLYRGAPLAIQGRGTPPRFVDTLLRSPPPPPLGLTNVDLYGLEAHLEEILVGALGERVASQEGHLPALLCGLLRWAHERKLPPGPCHTLSFLFAALCVVERGLPSPGGALLFAHLLRTLLGEVAPLVPLSTYFAAHSWDTLRLTGGLTTPESWGRWSALFLNGAVITMEGSARALLHGGRLLHQIQHSLRNHNGATLLSWHLFAFIVGHPVVDISTIVDALHCSRPAAAAALKVLIELGCVGPLTAQKRNRTYGFLPLLELLETEWSALPDPLLEKRLDPTPPSPSREGKPKTTVPPHLL